jgi:hypothetical protein
MLTVLTVFSAFVLTLIILVPVQPSRENVISMPGVRRNVCARRSRPASARGFFVRWVAANVERGRIGQFIFAIFLLTACEAAHQNHRRLHR